MCKIVKETIMDCSETEESSCAALSGKRILIQSGDRWAGKDLGDVLGFALNVPYNSVPDFSSALALMQQRKYHLVVIDPFDELLNRCLPSHDEARERLTIGKDHPWKGLLNKIEPWKDLIAEVERQKVPVIVFSSLLPGELEACGYKHHGPYAVKPARTTDLIEYARTSLIAA